MANGLVQEVAERKQILRALRKKVRQLLVATRKIDTRIEQILRRRRTPPLIKDLPGLIQLMKNANAQFKVIPAFMESLEDAFKL